MLKFKLDQPSTLPSAVQDETSMGFIFITIAWWCIGGHDVLVRRQGFAKAAFEVASDIKDAFEEWHLHFAFAWTVVNEESWVTTNAGNA